VQRVTTDQATAAALTMCRWRAQLRADRAQTAAANNAAPPEVPTVIEIPLGNADGERTSPPGTIDLGVEMVRRLFADEGSAAW
jgi:hypothetical protein